MITYLLDEQGSAEWLKSRQGLLTASNFAIAMGKGATRTRLLRQIAAASLWGAADDSYQSPAMARGSAMEAEARLAFAVETGLVAAEVGLALNSDCPGLGASLDGLIGDTVGLEIKCPSVAVHVGYLADNQLPAAYKWQVHGQMLVCQLGRVHFYSYHPSMPPLHIVVDRDDDMLAELKAKLDVFLTELEQLKTTLEQCK